MPSPYRLPRYQENWSFLQNPAASHSPLDGLKYIPLSSTDPDSYLSLGGESRLTYEFFDNNNFGAGPQDDDGFILQRYMLHADLHLGKSFRLFADIKSNLEDGRTGGPRPTDTDVIDLHQAFVDISPQLSNDATLTFRPGRQELLYGSFKLISNRNGPNTRLSFDALKLIYQTGAWQVDGFFARPVEIDPGSFDDDTDDDKLIWGIYSTLKKPDISGGIDAYYIGFRNEKARFNEPGIGTETRHTLGTRHFGKQNGWDWNAEGFLQGGEYTGSPIFAWSASADTGYTFPDVTLAPRVALRSAVISGDTNPDDNRLGTFNAMFPRGGYFGEIGLLGPANLMHLHPSLDLNLTRQTMLTFESMFFWRYSTDDGLYNPAGVPFRPDTGSSARYVGTQPSVILTHRPMDQISVIATYTLFLPGDFIDDTGASDTISFFRLELNFRF